MGYERIASRIREGLSPAEQARLRYAHSLNRSDYLALVAASDLIVDPASNDVGGSEMALLPALEALMIGTPVVTLERQATRSAIGEVLRSIPGVPQATLDSCIAGSVEQLADGVQRLLTNRSEYFDVRKANKRVRDWLATDRIVVLDAWKMLVERAGRPHAQHRVRMRKRSGRRKRRSP